MVVDAAVAAAVLPVLPVAARLRLAAHLRLAGLRKLAVPAVVVADVAVADCRATKPRSTALKCP